jgi:hypothetical protein
MSKGLNILIIVVALLSLSSCGYVIRESGFLYTDFVKDSRSSPGAINIWDNPRISLASSCDGTNYTATFGPYIAVPLFIIPNPLLPFTYPYHQLQNATITLAVSTPTVTSSADTVSAKLLLNGVPLEIDHIEETLPAQGLLQRHYIYRSNMRCGSLDDSKLIAEIEIPQQTLPTRTLFYRHRWRVEFEGI